MHKENRITVSEDQLYLMKYDIISGHLKIHESLFVNENEEIAIIICHEYRHSRQNYGKFLRYVSSFIFNKNGDESIIENDAYLFDLKAREAIRGKSIE